MTTNYNHTFMTTHKHIDRAYFKDNAHYLKRLKIILQEKRVFIRLRIKIDLI